MVNAYQTYIIGDRLAPKTCLDHQLQKLQHQHFTFAFNRFAYDG